MFRTMTLSDKFNQDHEIKMDELGRVCSTHGEGRNSHKILVGNYEEKRSRRRWEDKFKIYLGLGNGVDSSGSGSEPLVFFLL